MTNDEAQRHLEQAVEAAGRGDVRSFVVELGASHALDGILGGLRRQWPGAEESALEAIVAEASNALYKKVAVDRCVIGNAGAYLWGTARNMVRKRHEAGILDTVPLTDSLELTAQATGEQDDTDDDARRAEALRRARALLPRLGLEVVQRVMGFIFDGVEKGDPYLDNSTIAAALGLTPSTVRRSKSRGFQRLAEAAQHAGINMAGVLEVNTPEEEGDE